MFTASVKPVKNVLGKLWGFQRAAGLFAVKAWRTSATRMARRQRMSANTTATTPRFHHVADFIKEKPEGAELDSLTFAKLAY